ncbi:ABC transporter ATP-binding protein [uncultured Treponema sp.]|uniref:ABC transporter ATP-binding protein n=1 Tax=uncultured Treponema sp. TaxID=162155 RepID=UPI0025DADA64|nr:ABC transporter ATP-binding protein [uncultured Treponema sp.]
MENKPKQQKKSLLSWIFTFAGEKKPMYWASIFFAVLCVACALAPYIIIADIVRKLLDGVRDWNVYLLEAGITAAFWVGNAFFHMISTTLSHVATFNLLANIRKKLCDKLARVPLGSVLDMPSGTLKNILIERIDSMETTLAHILPEWTSNLLLPVVMFIYLFHLDARMGFASLITLPIGLIASCFMMRNMTERFQNAIDKTKILNDTAVEYINGIEVIKAFGKSKSSYEKFVVAAKEGSDCYVEWMRDCIWPFTIAFVIAPSTLLSVLPIGGYFFLNGTLSAVDFITIIILSMSVIQPLLVVYSYHDDIAKAGVIFGEVGGILYMPELERPEKDIKTPKDNSIVLKDVRFSYKKDSKKSHTDSILLTQNQEKNTSKGNCVAIPNPCGNEILHGINLSLHSCSYTALVGPSGSGKSTIARLIASLWDVDSGSIEIGGVNIKNLSLEEYNRRVAYVSQDNFLFDLSVRENIRLGKPEATDREVEEIAKKSGCYDFIMSLENGFDTIVGGSGTHLSGGERQRIAIARAMMKNAPIVILDEATAYTDPENEAIIQEGVAHLVKGKTLIVIAHRLSTIQDADKIVVIKDGLVDSQGTHEELLAKDGLYKDMWEAHISSKDSGEAA